MSEALLVVENLRVQFGRLMAVDGISFELRGGDLLGLIGANGAGKTTTLRAAAGLQALTAGRIRVFGYDVATADPRVGFHLGFTPDTPSLYETLTVREFLEFVASCYDLGRRLTDERIDHWLERLWLGDKVDAKISSLSRGMRQRLAVARTLLPDPHVILLDEPAAGLDPAGRIQFRQLLASLRDQGKAIIVSSHILADLAEFSTHVAIMERGRLLRFGTVSQVAGEADRPVVTYRILLARRMGDVATRLATIDGLEQVHVDGDVIVLQYDAGREAAARLLAEMISAGLPVAEFQARKADLETVYLQSGARSED